jgi:shikimate kinase
MRVFRQTDVVKHLKYEKMTDQKINDLLLEIHENNTHKIKSIYDFNQKSDEFRAYQNLLLFKMYKELDLVIMVTGGSVALSDKGLRISENGGWIKHLESEKEKQDFEVKKSKIDFKLANETLKELPKTKLFAIVGFIIAVVLALKEIGIWIWQLCCQ